MHTRSRHVVRECSRWVVGAASNCIMGPFWETNFHPVSCATWQYPMGSLSSDVFERRASTESGPFPLIGSGLAWIFGQIVSIRIKTLSNTNLVASSHIIKEKASLSVDVRRSEKPLLNLPNKRRQRPKTVPQCNSKHQRPSITKHLKMASRP